MSISQTHYVVLRKFAQRALNTAAIERNIATITASTNAKALSIRGWQIASNPNPATGAAWQQDEAIDNPDAKFVYYLHFTVKYERRDDRQPDTYELASIVKKMNQKASQPTSGLWEVIDLDGNPFTAPEDDDDDKLSDLVGYADVTMPDEWGKHFSHLYGVYPHITRLRLAIEAGIDSDWRKRLHCVLIGKPGCGKSDICDTLKSILGDDAVMSLDATATTSAGIIQDLSEAPILPRIIVIEEIEKATDDAMRVFLGMMDLRGEVRKVTARGKIQRDTRVLVIATVNNEAKFNRMNEGALSSRFSNRIYFKRPSRDVLSLILQREISQVGGSDEWITSVLNYCDEYAIVDPRVVIALALTGKDYWLTGEYEQWLQETGPEVDDDD